MRGFANSAVVGLMSGEPSLQQGADIVQGADASLGMIIQSCKAEMKLHANPVYVSYCGDRCTLWQSDYGVSFCGANVKTDATALVNCVYKMEQGACLTSPTVAPSDSPTSPTTAATVVPTIVSVPTPATATSTTVPTVTTTIPTTPAPTTAAHRETATPPHRIGHAPGYWTPNDHPEKSVGHTPKGPNGECIWGWNSSAGSPGGTYAGIGSKVYQNKYWTDASDVPGKSSVWTFVTDCVGTAPVSWTEASMAAVVENPDRFTMFYDPWTPAVPTKGEIAAIEEALSKEEQVKVLKEAVAVLPADEVEKISPGNAGNPENVKRVESFLTEVHWEKMFPFRHEAYSYSNFLKAVGAFPSYCHTYTDGRNSDAICKKLIAASFAHYSQETGANAPAWTLNMNDCKPENKHEAARQYFDANTPIPTYLQGLYWLRETPYSGANAETIVSTAYARCDPQHDQPWSIVFECPGNVTYYGRGSKQLSWNYNYGLFSNAIYGDTSVLLKNPRAVAETWLNFASGIWFAVTPQAPKPPMVWALDGTWKKNSIDSAAGLEPGFGATIEIINGGFECRGASTSPQAAHRIKAYTSFMELFGLTVPADESNDCAGSKGFPLNSPVSTKYYWNKDWSKPFTCKVGSVQSPFTVVTPGDYGRCVDFYWRSHVMLKGKEIIKNGD